MYVVCLGNVAFQKSASQIGTFDSTDANRSVDGYVDGQNDRCSHPLAESGTNAWWMVDLGDNYVISKVTIYSGLENARKYFSCETL